MHKTFNVIAYKKGNEYESIYVSCFKQAWTSKMTEQISAIKIFKPFCVLFKVFLAEKSYLWMFRNIFWYWKNIVIFLNRLTTIIILTQW